MRAPLTLELARRARSLRFEELPADVVERARHALLDWFGVTIAGSQEEAPRILLDALGGGARSDREGVAVVGRGERLPALDAALVNGTASHVLDFDDVNLRLIGHVTAATCAAVLALAEQRDADGAELITAFVAGYETVGRAAVAIGPDPYLRGFHVTGTIGTLGAAAACARLLALEEPASAVALSLAATQAAGLKSNFGTMTKSLHAGSACRNGLLAALLAKRGFTANTDALEAGQGLAAAHGGALDAEAALAEPPAGWHLRENLFKYHASCFLTHAVIDAIGEALASGRVVATDVEHVGIHVSELELGACAIPAPADALQVKFSMAHLAAMALLDRNMSAISDEDALDPELIAMRARVALIDDAQPERPRVEIALRDGSVVEAMHDATTPEPDLELQRSRLAEKFTTLAAPVLGGRGAAELLAALQALDGSMPVGALMSLTAPLARA